MEQTADVLANAAPVAVDHPAKLTRKSLGQAEARFAVTWGNAIAWNTYHKLLSGGLVVVIAVLAVDNMRLRQKADTVKPVIVRVDQVGQWKTVADAEAQAVLPDAETMRTVFREFVIKYKTRLRGSTRRDHPVSLFFIDQPYRQTLMPAQQKELETFYKSALNPEVEVEVLNSSLSNVDQPPYRAEVIYRQRYLQSGTRSELRPADLWTAFIDFEHKDRLPTDSVHVNPYGLFITNMRFERAYSQAAQTPDH
jgi:type IV secretory pathway TrbF-like protein